RSIGPLTNALRVSTGLLRRNIVKALGKMGDSEAIPALMEALADSEGALRIDIVTALGQIGDGRAVTALIGLCALNDEGLRRAIVEAFGAIGDERAVRPMIDLYGASAAAEPLRESIRIELQKLATKADQPIFADLLGNSDAA